MKWFQVDSDTPNDPKIRAVYRGLGLEGIGGLFLLWCFIADHGTKRPGWSIDSKGPIPIDDLRDACKLDEQKFHELVAICTSSGHFDERRWQSKNVIAIRAMARRADTYTKRNVRTRFEDAAKSSRRMFANKTTQDKTKNPPTPLSGKGGRYTRKELDHAKAVRRGRMGCVHSPRCESSDACVRLIAAEVRAKAS